MGIVGIYARKSKENDSTSITQQIQLGIDFCEKLDFQYQVYEDVKSGFKITDEKDSFKNRPGIMKLVSDIKSGDIDKIWVWEASRLSRNDITRFHFNQILKKHKVLLYIRDTEYDLTKPKDKLFKGLLDEIAEYERSEIVDRVTRGVHEAIDRGVHAYRILYGYKKDGKTTDEYINWTPVDSEIEKIKYLFKNYGDGKSIKTILTDLGHKETKTLSGRQEERLYRRWERFIKNFIYTGYLLNTDGREIYNKFMNYEIDSIRELENERYYVKSMQFPVQIISVNDWIQVNEKLHASRIVYRNKMRKTNKEFLTGVIECPYCNEKYFLYDGERYRYYKHFSNKGCKQRPKSLKVEILNKTFEVFFFYFYLVYDDTKRLIEESQKLLKINQTEIKEKIRKINKDNNDIDIQIENFKTIYKKKTNDIKTLELILEKEKDLKNEKEDLNIILTQLENELYELDSKLRKDDLELTYYDTKEVVINFIEKMNNEEKRASIMKIVNYCQLFTNYLLIDTGKLLFVFDIREDYKLPQSIIDEFKTDVNFKDNFINNRLFKDNGVFNDRIKDFLNTPPSEAVYIYSESDILDIENELLLHLIIRRLGEREIKEYYIVKPENRKIMEEKFDLLRIDYNLNNIQKVISFTNDIESPDKLIPFP